MRQPPKRMTGQSPLAQWLNQLLEFAISCKPISSPTVKASDSPRGTILTAAGQAGGSPPSGAEKYHFKQSLGDYFLTEEGIAVAKPANIRNSITQEIIYGTVFDMTYPHNPAGGGPSADPLAYVYRVATIHNSQLPPEVQGVTPQYKPRGQVTAQGGTFIQKPDEITAIECDTGVMSDPLDLVTSANGKPVAIGWLQISPGSPAWTKFSNQGF